MQAEDAVPAITELSLIDAETEPWMMVKLSQRADVPATSQAGGFSMITFLGGVDAVGRSLIELAQTWEKSPSGPDLFSPRTGALHDGDPSEDRRHQRR